MTTADLTSALKIMAIACEAIRGAGRLPDGHLYAVMMSTGMSHSAYGAMVRQIVRTGLVRLDGEMLVWIG